MDFIQAVLWSVLVGLAVALFLAVLLGLAFLVLFVLLVVGVMVAAAVLVTLAIVALFGAFDQRPAWSPGDGGTTGSPGS